ncbi:hypothetical protein ABTM63_19990, partial [Acinetobacter baumannii]
MIAHTKALLRRAKDDEFFARPMTEAVARLLQGAELLQHSPHEVADIFLATRGTGVSEAWGCHFGTLAL